MEVFIGMVPRSSDATLERILIFGFDFRQADLNTNSIRNQIMADPDPDSFYTTYDTIIIPRNKSKLSIKTSLLVVFHLDRGS